MQARELKDKILKLENHPGGNVHECPPFAIINPSDKITEQLEDGTQRERFGRNYKWGFCDAYDDEYSDFNRLYKLIISNLSTLTNPSVDILWSQLIQLTHVSMKNYIKRNKAEDADRRHRESQSKLVRGLMVGTSMLACAVGGLFLTKLKNQ